MEFGIPVVTNVEEIIRIGKAMGLLAETTIHFIRHYQRALRETSTLQLERQGPHEQCYGKT